MYLPRSSLAAVLLGTGRGPGRRVCLGRLRVGGGSSRRGWGVWDVWPVWASCGYCVIGLFCQLPSVFCA